MKRPEEHKIEECDPQVVDYIDELEHRLKNKPKPILRIELKDCYTEEQFVEINEQIDKLRKDDLGREYHIVLTSSEADMEILK